MLSSSFAAQFQSSMGFSHAPSRLVPLTRSDILRRAKRPKQGCAGKGTQGHETRPGQTYFWSRTQGNNCPAERRESEQKNSMLKPLAGALGSHAAEHHRNNGEDRRDRTNNFRAEERVLPPSIGPTILRCIIVPEPPLTSAGGPYYRIFLCQRGDLAHFDSANTSAHEALHELTLENQKCNEERCRCHQCRGADDSPVDALIARREHLQADGNRP